MRDFKSDGDLVGDREKEFKQGGRLFELVYSEFTSPSTEALSAHHNKLYQARECHFLLKGEALLH